jgi:hypothetical protein
LSVGSAVELIERLHELVPEFTSGTAIVDWIHVEASDASAAAARSRQRAASSA